MTYTVGPEFDSRKGQFQNCMLGITVLPSNLHVKQHPQCNAIRYFITICGLLLSLGLVGCERNNDLHVKNNFDFPIIVSQQYQDEKKKPLAAVIGSVPAGQTLTFSRAISFGVDPLNITFQDPSGKFVGHVEKTYSQGYSQSTHRWEIIAEP